MRKPAAIIILILIMLPLYILPPSTVRADEGYAKVYILCLPSVGGWTYPDRSYDPSQTKKGAIHALTFGERTSLPLIHPLRGKNPPFYSIDYQVVTSWYTYENLIESYEEVVVVNTHGEIIPVPSSYNREGWTDKIAEAMLTRRVTWVHTAGYPFYHAWYEGAGDKETPAWGAAGFKRLMSAINLGDVTCWPPGEETVKVDITRNAETNLLAGGWPDLHRCFFVERGRPLNGSHFQEYLALPLWGAEYYTGAVIPFVKPSERIGAGFGEEDTYNYGAYIHVGTTGTYDGDKDSTDGDKWRGYVATAAALWVETNGYEPQGANDARDYGGGYSTEWGLTATPVIVNYDGGDASMFHVRIGFGLYGCMKTNAGDEIGEVQFRAGYIPSGCTLEMKSHRSRNGYKYENATLSGLYYQSGKSIVQTACFFLQFAKIHPVIGGIVLGIEGVMLFSDWIDLTSSVTDPESGVDEPASYVNFKYDPEDEYEEPGDGYRYGEFQSMIFLELNVDMTGREQWTIVPMQWRIYMLDASGGTGTYVTGDISIAIYDNYYKDGYEAVVFFEDFKEDMSGWSTGDTNSLAGYDYWGITQYGGPGYKAWCATVGNNSVKGGTNEEQGFYDKGMNASLTRSVDLRPYQSVILRYHLWYVISSGDHLKVEYYQGGAWATADTLTGSEWIDYWEETIIPTSAEKIRFRFYSNDDNDVGYGVFINHIELVAEMPNDANTTTDAGDGFDDSIHIGISETKINYPGYLNDDEDFYGFSISSDDVANERIIEVQVHPPSATKFKATLYDPYEEKKAGPATSIYYALSAEDTAGEWWIKIYPVKGFGPYDFDTRLKTPSGGCPYISAWNGEEYVLDNNLLLASEHTLGDVTDYYRLEQSLVANLDGTYSLLLSEFENEHDYFDRVQLLAVDHTPNISVAVSRSGEILTYKNPYTPKSAVDDNEENVKHLLTHVDGKYYQGYNASHIILNFGNLDTCNGAKLVLRSDEIIKWSIHVQIQDDNGEWRDVASFIPRAYWSTDIINLSKFLKDEEGAIKVRLHFTAEHKLDYVGLDTSPQAKINIQYGELLSAIHTSEGDIKESILLSDDIYTELIPGQSIQLTFALPQHITESRTYIIMVEGRYRTFST